MRDLDGNRHISRKPKHEGVIRQLQTVLTKAN